MRKKIMRSILGTLILILCLCLLSACGRKEESSGNLPLPSIPVHCGEDTSGPKKIRMDEERLVLVSIEEGSATLSFDLDRWDTLYDISNPDKVVFPAGEGDGASADLREGPFQITGLEGPVKDALIAQVTGLDWLYYSDFVTPAVILLMEDGGVEWLLADPYISSAAAEAAGIDQPFASYGRLPFLDDIVALSLEPDGEGFGESAVFATDGQGQRYDLRLPCNMANIFDDVWTCELSPPFEGDGPLLYGYFRFYPNGELEYEVRQGGYSTGELQESWAGSYEFILAENPDRNYPPGTLVMDMDVTWQIYGGEEGGGEDMSHTRIDSSFRFDAHDGAVLNLYLNSGEPLYHYTEYPDFYTFWLGDPESWVYEDYPDAGDYSNMDDEELVSWLISQISEAYDCIYCYGMSSLVTGEVTYFDDGDIGRNVWLGKDSKDKFTRRILYSIGLQGAIYQYDALKDNWILLHPGEEADEYPARTILAYVKYRGYLGDGLVELLADEVSWVDDLSAPNGYRIENEVEQWLPYIITKWTSIELWRYDSDEGMVLAPEGLGGFIHELEKGWREGVLLAHLTVAEGMIEMISEQYLP